MQDFTRGKIGPQIIRFSIPIILGNLFMQLYQLIDSAIVGQFIGKEALAAVGASMPVIFAIISLVIGIGSGASVVISQYFGANDRDKVRITSDTLHIFLLITGFAIAIIGLIASDTIFRLISLPEEIIPMASSYLKVYLGGIFLLFGFNTISSILRGIGDSKTPLYFLIISAVLNVILDLLFIVVFKWGVASAAWATVISQGVAYILAIAYINKHNPIFDINLLKLKYDHQIFLQCVKYGLPTGIQQAFVALGAVALSKMINEFGVDVVAGYSAGMRIDALAVVPAMNFSMALTSFVGQNVGAGRYDRVQKGLNKTLLYSSITCIAITLIIVFLGKPIISIFTNVPEVIDIGHQYLVIVSSFYIIFSNMFILNGMMRGAGAVMFPMVSTILSLWVVRVPMAWILSRGMGEVGIWLSIPAGWIIGLAMVYVYYKSGKWRNKGIIKNMSKIMTHQAEAEARAEMLDEGYI